MLLRRFYPVTNAALTFVAFILLLASAQAQQETVLHSFGKYPDGASPIGALVLDANGDAFGATYAGGVSGNGAVFTVTPSGKEKVLYSFAGSPDGSGPSAALAFDANGNLYGTTAAGGANGKALFSGLRPRARRRCSTASARKPIAETDNSRARVLSLTPREIFTAPRPEAEPMATAQSSGSPKVAVSRCCTASAQDTAIATMDRCLSVISFSTQPEISPAQPPKADPMAAELSSS